MKIKCRAFFYRRETLELNTAQVNSASEADKEIIPCPGTGASSASTCKQWRTFSTAGNSTCPNFPKHPIVPTFLLDPSSAWHWLCWPTLLPWCWCCSGCQSESPWSSPRLSRTPRHRWWCCCKKRGKKANFHLCKCDLELGLASLHSLPNRVNNLKNLEFH